MNESDPAQGDRRHRPTPRVAFNIFVLGIDKKKYFL